MPQPYQCFARLTVLQGKSLKYKKELCAPSYKQKSKSANPAPSRGTLLYRDAGETSWLTLWPFVILNHPLCFKPGRQKRQRFQRSTAIKAQIPRQAEDPSPLAVRANPATQLGDETIILSAMPAPPAALRQGPGISLTRLEISAEATSPALDQAHIYYAASMTGPIPSQHELRLRDQRHRSACLSGNAGLPDHGASAAMHGRRLAQYRRSRRRRGISGRVQRSSRTSSSAVTRSLLAAVKRIPSRVANGSGDCCSRSRSSMVSPRPA